MKWKVKFTEELYNVLNIYLFSTSPKENGCFLLANAKKHTLFITEIFYPEQEGWIEIDKDLCIPKPPYISRACIKADINKKALIFVHTHPQDFHPSTFSYIDRISNNKLFNNLKGILSSPLGSFVFSKKGIHGVIFSNNSINNIDSFTIYGDTIQIIKDAVYQYNSFNKDEFDRQLRLMNVLKLKTLIDLKVVIVGLGGTGSPLAVMLAKMGVRNFGLYDFDKLEKHNLPRIYGATKSDIGNYKVDIVKKHIESFRNSEIDVFYNGIDNTTDLTKYDVIFGCVDNHLTRDIINRVAYENAIPYIDTGASIPVDSSGKTIQSVMSVNTVLPNKPCLWCSNTLNAIRILEESMTKEQINEREKDGYLSGVNKAPSIITLTTAVSAFAINRLLNILGVLPGEKFPEKIMFEFNNNLYTEINVELNKKCICQKSNPFH